MHHPVDKPTASNTDAPAMRGDGRQGADSVFFANRIGNLYRGFKRGRNKDRRRSPSRGDPGFFTRWWGDYAYGIYRNSAVANAQIFATITLVDRFQHFEPCAFWDKHEFPPASPEIRRDSSDPNYPLGIF
jgi:hypothetical protein